MKVKVQINSNSKDTNNIRSSKQKTNLPNISVQSKKTSNHNKPAIVNLNIESDPTDTKTTIEFLLSTLVSKMKLKANQALTLLSNSNTLLVHVIIKGFKGEFLPVTNWYKELLLHCKFMVKLFESEAEGLVSALHVLDIIKAGLYSKCLEVSNWALRLLGKTAAEMNETGMSGIAWDWFVAENGGLQVLLSSISKRHELINENLVSVLCQFGRHNFMELFAHNIRLAISTQAEYMELTAQMLEPLKDYKLSRDELINKGVVAYWLDFACRKADVVNSHIKERSTALVLLLELWLSFPVVIEGENEYSDLIIRLLQRAARDKVYNLQMVSISLLFKLLENFALERSIFALPIYKSLTFALVENYQKISLREFILSNFKVIFESSSTIPANILLDPFIKQIYTSDKTSFSFNLFDLDFLNCVAHHPKLKPKNAMQILDLLVKTYVYNQVLSSCIIESLNVIVVRFKSNPRFKAFVTQLIKYSLGLYCDNIEKCNEILKIEVSVILAQNTRILKLISIIISLEDNLVNEIIRHLIIDTNKLIMQITNTSDNELLDLLNLLGKNITYDTNINSIDQHKYNKKASPLTKSKHHSMLSRDVKVIPRTMNLKKYSTEDTMNNSIQNKGRNQFITNNQQINQTLNDNRKLDKPLNDIQTYSPLIDSNSLVREQKNNSCIKRDISPLYDFNRFSLSVIPKQGKLYGSSVSHKKTNPNISFYSNISLTHKKVKGDKEESEDNLMNQQQNLKELRNESAIINESIVPNRDNKGMSIRKKPITHSKEYTLSPYRRGSTLEEKALMELEQLKQRKEKQTQKKQLEETRKALQEMNRRQTLMQQLEIRKIEQNVASMNKTNTECELIFNEGTYKQTIPHNKEAKVELLSLDEEEKDTEALKLFIKQHKRIFRYLYEKYTNSGFSPNINTSFDQLKEKLNTINMAEIIKMLKDYNISILSLTQISSFIQLINLKLLNKRNIMILTYPGFIEFFVQIAIHIFSKDPNHNVISKPAVDYVKLLLNHFQHIAKIKGENTMLYDNPNATTLGDPELIEELTTCVNINPYYPLPEGYKKLEEKYIKENYVIPTCAQIPEPHRICIEIVDDLLNDIFGIHILEPITTYEYKIRVVPVIGKLYQRDSNDKNYMLPVTKKLRRSMDPVKHVISLKQMNEKEIEPKLTGKMKVIIAAAKNEMKVVVKEVADVVAEIVEAVVEGRDSIGTKMKWGPSLVLNRVVKEKFDKRRDEEVEHERKEQKRKLRAVLLRNVIQDFRNERKKKEYETCESMKREKELERLRTLKEQQVSKERRKKLLEQKQKRQEEQRIKEQQENKDHQLIKKKNIEEHKQLRKQKNEQFKLDLQNIINARDKRVQDKEAKKQMEALKIERYQKTVNIRLAKEKERCAALKEQKARFCEFMNRKDIQLAITRYKKPLHYIFKHFSRIGELRLTGDLDQAMNTLDLQKFSKFCLHFQIIPKLLSIEDAISLFKQTIKEKLLNSRDSQLVDYKDFEELLLRIALVTKDRIDNKGDLNKEYIIEDVDTRLINDLMNFMCVKESDNKIILDKRLNKIRREIASMTFKRSFGNNGRNALYDTKTCTMKETRYIFKPKEIKHSLNNSLGNNSLPERSVQLKQDKVANNKTNKDFNNELIKMNDIDNNKLEDDKIVNIISNEENKIINNTQNIIVENNNINTIEKFNKLSNHIEEVKLNHIESTHEDNKLLNKIVDNERINPNTIERDSVEKSEMKIDKDAKLIDINEINKGIQDQKISNVEEKSLANATKGDSTPNDIEKYFITVTDDSKIINTSNVYIKEDVNSLIKNNNQILLPSYDIKDSQINIETILKAAEQQSDSNNSEYNKVKLIPKEL